MFVLKEFKPHPNGCWMKISYDYPLLVAVNEIEITSVTKLQAMYSFSSNINTILDLRIEEFAIVIETKIIQHFKYTKCYPFYHDNQFLGFYWDWKAFLEQIAEKRNHRHGYAKALRDNIYLFKNIIPQYEALKGYKQLLIDLVAEIELLCKQIMEVSRKIQKEYDNNKIA